MRVSILNILVILVPLCWSKVTWSCDKVSYDDAELVFDGVAVGHWFEDIREPKAFFVFKPKHVYKNPENLNSFAISILLRSWLDMFNSGGADIERGTLYRIGASKSDGIYSACIVKELGPAKEDTDSLLILPGYPPSSDSYRSVVVDHFQSQEPFLTDNRALIEAGCSYGYPSTTEPHCGFDGKGGNLVCIGSVSGIYYSRNKLGGQVDYEFVYDAVTGKVGITKDATMWTVSEEFCEK